MRSFRADSSIAKAGHIGSLECQSVCHSYGRHVTAEALTTQSPGSKYTHHARSSDYKHDRCAISLQTTDGLAPTIHLKLDRVPFPREDNQRSILGIQVHIPFFFDR